MEAKYSRKEKGRDELVQSMCIITTTAQPSAPEGLRQLSKAAQEEASGLCPQSLL